MERDKRFYHLCRRSFVSRTAAAVVIVSGVVVLFFYNFFQRASLIFVAGARVRWRRLKKIKFWRTFFYFDRENMAKKIGENMNGASVSVN